MKKKIAAKVAQKADKSTMEIECVDLTGEEVSEPEEPSHPDVESSSYDVDSLEEAKSSEGNELTSSVDEREIDNLADKLPAKKIID